MKNILTRYGRVAAAVVFAAALLGCLTSGRSSVDASRIGVCSWSYQKPVVGVAAEMEKAGVVGIQLALGPFIAPDKRHGEAEGAEAFALAKAKIASGEWKLMSTMISFPQEDYSTLDTIRKTGGIVPDDVWPRNKELFAAAAKMSGELGSPYLAMHAGFIDEHDKVAYAKFIDRLTWLRDECAKHGVKLILESGQETARELASLMKAVPGVGINFDPANMILYAKGNPIEALDHLMPWIDQIHVKDANLTKVPGTWGEEVPWGEGQVGGAKFLSVLLAKGYKGNFVIEREGGAQRARDIALAVEKIRR